MTAKITAQHIIAATCKHYDITPARLKGQSRKYQYARPRQVAYKAIRDVLGYSHPRIGWLIGRRDHSTILHGIKKLEARNDPSEARDLASIKEDAQAIASDLSRPQMAGFITMGHHTVKATIRFNPGWLGA